MAGTVAQRLPMMTSVPFLLYSLLLQAAESVAAGPRVSETADTARQINKTL